MSDSIKHCATCEQPMRPYKTRKEDYPGTVARAGRNCVTCVARPRPAKAADEPCVLVRSDLRPSTFRKLTAIAKLNGVDVGMLLSKIADVAMDAGAKR